MRVAPPNRRNARSCSSAQGHHKQPGAPVLAGLRIAHHRAGAVINLRFLARSGDDHHASFGHLCAAQLAHEALHALVATGEAVLGDQVLPDGLRIPASAETQLDGFPVRFAETGGRNAVGTFPFRAAQLHAKPGDHLILVGRF